jgi:hypothetical protein
MVTNKKTKEEKRKEMAEFIAKLKATPQEKLSKAAKYLLAHENDEPVYYDMKAVMK